MKDSRTCEKITIVTMFICGMIMLASVIVCSVAVSNARSAIYDINKFMKNADYSTSKLQKQSVGDWTADVVYDIYIGILDFFQPKEDLLSYKANIKFDKNSTRPNHAGYVELVEFIKVVKRLDNVCIQVESHTAKRFPGVNDGEVLSLCERCSTYVKEFLIRNGIPLNRLDFICYGDMKLLNEENPFAEENCRVEIFFNPDLKM